MTLIVGVNTGSRLLLISGTRITHPDVTQIEQTLRCHSLNFQTPWR
jgi:hypothetical protein